MPWHGRRSIASRYITRSDEESVFLAFCKRLVHRLPGTVVMKPPAIIAHEVRGAVSDQISRFSEAEKLRWSDGPLHGFLCVPGDHPRLELAQAGRSRVHTIRHGKGLAHTPDIEARAQR